MPPAAVLRRSHTATAVFALVLVLAYQGAAVSSEPAAVVGSGAPSASGCPTGMVRVTSAPDIDVCIDVYEAGVAHGGKAWPFNRPVDALPDGSYVATQGAGVMPQAYISADQASQACKAAGKRLCTQDEWVQGCRGPQDFTYPYGNTYNPEACNERRELNPVVELFGPGATFNWTELNDPRLDKLPGTVSCVSSWGLHDMAGNVEEWVSTTTAEGHGIFRGGYFMHVTVNGLGCEMTTVAHAQWYHDYSLSFRCCADPTGATAAPTTAAIAATEPVAAPTVGPEALAGKGSPAAKPATEVASVAGAASPATAAGATSCPDGMVEVPSKLAVAGSICMDRYEAPNQLGQSPMVMFDFYEAQAWCGARGKRLCYDDEFQTACAGPDHWQYPYGNTRVPGKCNDNNVWRQYNQTILNYWVANISTPDITGFGDLMGKVLALNIEGSMELAEHLSWLYQGHVAGEDTTNCTSYYGAVDTVGNVEEWTARRTPGGPLFHGCLKGRYWADTRTCQDVIFTHGDLFRFYEIGFRCCMDMPTV